MRQASVEAERLFPGESRIAVKTPPLASTQLLACSSFRASEGNWSSLHPMPIRISPKQTRGINRQRRTPPLITLFTPAKPPTMFGLPFLTIDLGALGAEAALIVAEGIVEEDGPPDKVCWL
ncbi:hypothetical protein VTH06DRAFT_4890 [Thermothelomyces fergusii]